MDVEDRRAYIQRYESRLMEFGYSPESLGWGVNGRQEIRFRVLADYVLRSPKSSVLDVGCGFGDLYDFLIQHGWHGQYTGIDIVPGLLEIARERHRGLDLRELDITEASGILDRFDFVIASGVFNARLKVESNEKHISDSLQAMHQKARIAACADFLSTYVDFQKPGSWHTDPLWAFEVAKHLSKRVLLRHDYMPYEFALILFQDDSVSEQNVFQEFEQSLS